MPLPANWAELTPIPSNVNDLKAALKLLKQALPNRYNYENLSPRRLLHMMVIRQNPTTTNYVPGARVYCRRNGGGVVDVAAFFFLRLQVSPAVHLTMGVLGDGTVNAAGLYQATGPMTAQGDLLDVCRTVNQVLDGLAIEVANEFALPGDLPGTVAGGVLRDTFNAAANSAQTAPGHLASLQPISLPQDANKKAWPPNLVRWQVTNL